MVQFPRVSRERLSALIQKRAAEIAVGEGDSVVIPMPSVIELREPQGLFGIMWALADYQSASGLGYVKVAAAEISAQFDIESDLT